MLAAVVFDQATFEHCVTTADVDIVSFDPAAKLPVYVSKTLVCWACCSAPVRKGR